MDREVDPSTSSDPSSSFRAFPRPIVRLERLEIAGDTTDNNNVSKRRHSMQVSKSTSKMPTKASKPSSSASNLQTEEFDAGDEVDLCLVTRASAHFNTLMDQFNCLMKIHTNKDTNFQVELSKLLQDLMVKIVVPSDAANPDKCLNFGHLALILQGSTSIYSKKVEFLADLFTQFLICLSREIGKAALGSLSENADEEAGDQSQTQSTDEERRQASKKKKQKSTQSVPFSVVEIKIGKNSRMDSIKKIQLRPKIFTVLYYNDQCEKDKSRVVALNPELAGETTCYRMWAPVNEDRGLLNPDCKDGVSSKFSSCDISTLEAIEEPQLTSEENLEDFEPPDGPMDFDSGDPDMDEPEDTTAETPSKPTEQTEVLGSKENNLVEGEPAAANADDPWKTLAPGDTIEDIRLQPQPPVPKFKSRVVLEIEEAYFKSWYKDAKKARGCFGDENIHEGLLLEKEGKLLDHPDAKNKRKRIDLDSDRNNKKTTKSVEEMLAHNESDDEDLLGFSDEKPVYQNPESLLNIFNAMNESDDGDLAHDDQENDFDNPPEEAPNNASLAISDDEENGENGFDWGMDVQLEDPLCVAARVDGFMKFMKQKFAEDEKKQKFSFKTYCDSILGNFPPVEQGEPQPSLQFKQLLKSSEDQGVARQLLATLMLANHKNVDVEGNTEGTLADNTLSLKLLKRTGHLPAFEEDDQF